MSSGARNWPFLMLTTRPVFAAATMRSVCRDRNAGICRTSATSADRRRLPGSWMSVRIGTPTSSLHAREDREAVLEARPAKRRERRAVRLVERRLEDVGHARRAARCRRSRAPSSRACASLSMTHGPGDQHQVGRARGRRRRRSRTWRTAARAGWSGTRRQSYERGYPLARRSPIAVTLVATPCERHLAACRPPRRSRRTADAAAAAST